MEINTYDAVKLAHKALADKFAKDISVLKIADISILADYFIIATAESEPQLRAMAGGAEKALTDSGLKLHHTEEFRGSKWLLMDFGAVIVHLFTGEEREFYNLDAVWRDAERVTFE